MSEISTFRIYLMRLLYVHNFVILGLSVWPEIINHAEAWNQRVDAVSGRPVKTELLPEMRSKRRGVG